jgi:hypothetical protein
VKARASQDKSHSGSDLFGGTDILVSHPIEIKSVPPSHSTFKPRLRIWTVFLYFKNLAEYLKYSFENNKNHFFFDN